MYFQKGVERMEGRSMSKHTCPKGVERMEGRSMSKHTCPELDARLDKNGGQMSTRRLLYSGVP